MEFGDVSCLPGGGERLPSSMDEFGHKRGDRRKGERGGGLSPSARKSRNTR